MSDAVASGRRALITGASSGIGMVYAERLAREGYDLILVARRRDRLVDLAEKLKRGNGIAAEVVCADLTDKQALARVETLAGGDEALSLLINNAGFAGYRPFVSNDPEVIDDLVDIHVRAVARLSRAALPGMVRRRKGAIINVASLLAISAVLPPDPLPSRATYAGAKAFILAFTQALAGELEGTGVDVQACLPGRVSTEFHVAHGIDTSKLPPAMTAEDVVTASLSALSRREVVCIPALANPALFSELTDAQIKVFRNSAMQPTLAERYMT
ncbi:SDR family oxidoreductase [Bradyrhizobium sp. BR 10261]|uniref:SDR family NAD(P)-dependent oxidoreductase n=1 Tax=Bradyrhizobium sp. BR 10261 TaxID=2749992 RepID=UPI001C64AE83|nr:SDR family oxidoreductase [Bradyrhizobium sp. BR 10261]MBW7964699.1 SDR family oxidoreductase [Bradyrhizobium sp. BR 10261]